MDVEFKTCDYCNDVFADCSSYISCESCWKNYCSSECARPKYNIHHYVESCVICRKEYIPEEILLTFLLNKFSLTRDDVKEL